MAHFMLEHCSLETVTFNLLTSKLICHLQVICSTFSFIFSFLELSWVRGRHGTGQTDRQTNGHNLYCNLLDRGPHTVVEFWNRKLLVILKLKLILLAFQGHTSVMRSFQYVTHGIPGSGQKRRWSNRSFTIAGGRNWHALLYRPKPIHCNYQFVHYSGFCRICPSILNRFKPNLQA